MMIFFWTKMGILDNEKKNVIEMILELVII